MGDFSDDFSDDFYNEDAPTPIVLGSQDDFENRLSSLLAPSWFGTGLTVVDGATPESTTPVLDSILAGTAYPLSWIYTLYVYTLLQERLTTSTGVWVDRSSYDLFGNALPRRDGELDPAFIARIQSYFSQQRQTRPGISEAVVELTGQVPKIIEFWNPGDTGAYDTCMGWDVAGMYGDLNFRNQIFVTAYRPTGGGIANVGGYDDGAGGWDVGAVEWIDDSWITVHATDDEIYATIADTVAAGVTAWTAIANSPDTTTAPNMYFGNIINTQDIPIAIGFFF